MKPKIGKNVTISDGVRMGNHVIIEDNVYLDYDVIIRDFVTIKANSVIGARCILGEYLQDFYEERQNQKHPLVIGANSIIRSDTIIYGDTNIGEFFQTGHHVTVREDSHIGEHVSIGTLSDIQGDCYIGDYVKIHSNVFIGMKACIKNYVWIFPCVVLTNDPTPPSYDVQGVTVNEYAVIAARSVILPGVTIESDALVAAGSTVVKNVLQYEVVGGGPAKVIADIRSIRNHRTGDLVYPWRYTFSRNMPWDDLGFDAWYQSLQLDD